MAVPALRRATYLEYLEAETSSGLKLEFLEGHLLAMAGGSVAHADLGGQLFALLSARLAGRPCRPSNSDQKLRVPEADFAGYPDISVYCGPRVRDSVDANALTNPTVLVEVLSPGTEAYDRGEKFSIYRLIPSLEHYVLVSTATIRVEVYTRNPDRSWTLRAYGPGHSATLDALGVSIPVDDLYTDVELDAPSRVAWRSPGA